MFGMLPDAYTDACVWGYGKMGRPVGYSRFFTERGWTINRRLCGNARCQKMSTSSTGTSCCLMFSICRLTLSRLGSSSPGEHFRNFPIRFPHLCNISNFAALVSHPISSFGILSDFQQSKWNLHLSFSPISLSPCCQTSCNPLCGVCEHGNRDVLQKMQRFKDSTRTLTLGGAGTRLRFVWCLKTAPKPLKFSFPRCHRDWYRNWSKSIKASNSDWVLDSDNSDNSDNSNSFLFPFLFSHFQFLSFQFLRSLDLKSTWPKNLAHPGRQKRSLQRQHQKRPCSHENAKVPRVLVEVKVWSCKMFTNWLDQEASSWLSRPVGKRLDKFLEFSWQNYKRIKTA